jgi:hypothetical protein
MALEGKLESIERFGLSQRYRLEGFVVRIQGKRSSSEEEIEMFYGIGAGKHFKEEGAVVFLVFEEGAGCVC